jgi:hypothetical protein
MPTDAHDPPDEGDEPADRDERRVRALEHLFREASEGEAPISPEALEKIGDALRGDPPGE